MRTLLLFVMLTPSILFAQKRGFDVTVFHNTMYNVGLFTENNLTVDKVPLSNPSVMVGAHYTSFGKNKALSISHGIDVFIPTRKPIMNAAPRDTYTFVTNALSYRFLNKKMLNASLRTDLKFLLEKEKFDSNVINSSANRWIWTGGFSIQPIPKKVPVKIVYQVNLTPLYIQTNGNLDNAYHYSNLGLEFSF